MTRPTEKKTNKINNKIHSAQDDLFSAVNIYELEMLFKQSENVCTG